MQICLRQCRPGTGMVTVAWTFCPCSLCLWCPVLCVGLLALNERNMCLVYWRKRFGDTFFSHRLPDALSLCEERTLRFSRCASSEILTHVCVSSFRNARCFLELKIRWSATRWRGGWHGCKIVVSQEACVTGKSSDIRRYPRKNLLPKRKKIQC